VLHPRCSGLDVHKDTVVAAVRCVSSPVHHEVKSFPTTTRGLFALADWLGSHGCTHVAMEATGVYWKPVWHVLEGRFEQHAMAAGVATVTVVRVGKRSLLHRLSAPGTEFVVLERLELRLGQCPGFVTPNALPFDEATIRPPNQPCGLVVAERHARPPDVEATSIFSRAGHGLLQRHNARHQRRRNATVRTP
jgi:hypothetical protein